VDIESVAEPGRLGRDVGVDARELIRQRNLDRGEPPRFGLASPGKRIPGHRMRDQCDRRAPEERAGERHPSAIGPEAEPRVDCKEAENASPQGDDRREAPPGEDRRRRC
jgi:hypothetical protein